VTSPSTRPTAAPSLGSQEGAHRCSGSDVLPTAVKATNTGTSVSTVVSTAGDGSFHFLQLPVGSYDVTITKEFQENQTPWLKFLMIAVSYQGNTWPLALGLIILATLILWLVDLRLEAITLVLLSSVNSLVNVAIKILIDRPRPTARLVDIIQGAGGPSFPSGHVMSYVAFWGLLFSFGIILFRDWRWWRIALMVVSALMFILVGPSRIYLGDHWASDVLGAYLIGGALLVIALWLYLFLKERGVLAPRREYAWYRQPLSHYRR